MNCKRPRFISSTRLLTCSIILFLAATPAVAQPLIATELLPLKSGTQWTYQRDGITEIHTVRLGTVNVNGVPTKVIDESPADATYYTNDAQGLRIHRQDIFDPDFLVTDTVTYSPPLPLMPAQMNIGQVLTGSGTATFNLVGIGTFPLAYDITTEIEGIENVTVPLREFLAVKVRATLTITGTVLGVPFNETEVDTVWLAEGVGLVKIIAMFQGIIETFELTAFTLAGPIPDIKANDSDGPVTIPSGSQLSITMALDADGNTAQADWWVLAQTPFGLFHLTLGGWTPGVAVTLQVPLVDLAPLAVLSTSGLPPGAYVFAFGVDLTVNGTLDQPLFFDLVVVNIQ